MMRGRSQSRGFTLIEVLTVLAVLSVVSTLGTMAYFRVDQYWRAAHARTELHAAADAIFARIRADFDSLLSPMRTGAVLKGEDARYEVTDEANRYFRAAFADDRCTFPVEVYDPVRQVPVRQRVTYRIARDGQPPQLVRESRPLTVAGETETPVAETAPALPASRTGALDLNIEYLRDGEWRDSWDSPGAPDALRVSITLMDALRPYEQISRKVIIPVYVD
jgi:prepilin-type N-terminal cleavage/methylation domain-containing protein